MTSLVKAKSVMMS